MAFRTQVSAVGLPSAVSCGYLVSFLFCLPIFYFSVFIINLKTVLVASQNFHASCFWKFCVFELNQMNCSSHHPFSKANCKCLISELFYLPSVHLPLVSTFFFFFTLPSSPPTSNTASPSQSPLTHQIIITQITGVSREGQRGGLRLSFILPFDRGQTECHAQAPSGGHLP